jgi:hypothetical protein
MKKLLTMFVLYSVTEATVAGAPRLARSSIAAIRHSMR